MGRAVGGMRAFGLKMSSTLTWSTRQVAGCRTGDWRSASAPPTISMISVVMASWRARFMTRLSLTIISSAFSVADFMARWRAACSEAAESSMAA